MLLCCVDFMLCNGLESPAGDGGSYYRLLAAAHWRAGENQIDKVSMDANQKLRLPLLRDTLVRGVEILDVAKPDTQLLNDNKRWLVSQEYTVTSFDSALYYLPPFEVLVNDKAYRSKALALKVYSIPVDTLHPDQFFWSEVHSGSTSYLGRPGTDGIFHPVADCFGSGDGLLYHSLS